MSTDKNITITKLPNSMDDRVDDDIDNFIITNKEDVNIHSVVDKLKNCNICDLSRIISYLTNLITCCNSKDEKEKTTNNEIIHNNTEYLNVKRHYEINLIKVKSIEYLNNCQYTKRYIPTEFSDYLIFDGILNNYINFLFDYYYNKQNVDNYYEKIEEYFKSLFSILELKIDILNHDIIENKIKIEYELLTSKILNLLTNINIIVYNKF